MATYKPKAVKRVGVRALITPEAKKALSAWAKKSKVSISYAAGYVIEKALLGKYG